MFQIISILIYIIPVIFVGSRLFRYFSGVYQARKFAALQPIPSVFVYHQRGSIIFWLLSPLFAPFLESLPFKWGQWIRYIKKDFAWSHKGELPLKELGSDVYWTVGPGGANLQIANAEIIAEVGHRWKDFSKQVENYQTMTVFGSNILSTEGSTWQRHRKITAPPFNERNSGLVFSESLAQGRAMLHAFTHDADNNPCPAGTEPVIENLIHWTMTAALHVLTGAAFDLKMTWPTYSVLVPDQKESPFAASNSKHTMSFEESFGFLHYLAFVILVPKWLLKQSPFKLLRHVLTCMDEFAAYLRELIANTEENSSKSDLLSAIVKAGKADEKMRLTESETIGNMFIFIMAGHETSSNVLQTSLLMLACEPEIQAKVHEEIDSIWASKKEGQDWSYTDDYPRMRTIMAVILETLRLFPPVIYLPKATTAPQIITFHPNSFSSPSSHTPPSQGPIQISIPANTEVSIDIVSVQRNPAYYPNPQAWLPSRWLLESTPFPQPPSSHAETSNESPAHANMFCPPKGAFPAFSTGFRACLGRKFAQVELATLLAVLLHEHRIELVREGNDSFDVTREKALRSIDDRHTGVAMRMRGTVRVKFVRR